MVRASAPYGSEVRTGETMSARGKRSWEKVKLRDAENVFIAQALQDVLFPCL